MSCIFCRIIAGEIPAKIIHKDDELIVIEDINPVAPLHLLLIPKKHIATVLDLSESDDKLVGRIYRLAADLARKYGVAENGFRIVANTNADAGQTVFHIHFHLLAGRAMGWPPG
ncbi:MAG: histidine triad nucleotide-binding protein [Geobacter sp.]|nr:histidine triad nucleotide-binding protein [Geobacter sp.]